MEISLTILENLKKDSSTFQRSLLDVGGKEVEGWSTTISLLNQVLRRLLFLGEVDGYSQVGGFHRDLGCRNNMKAFSQSKHLRDPFFHSTQDDMNVPGSHFQGSS